MSSAPLSLHFASLTAHASSLSRIILCVRALVSPSPPGFHGAHVGETRRVLYALARVLSEAAATLSALAPAASECAADARSLMYENQRADEAAALQVSLRFHASNTAAQLSAVSDSFQRVSHAAERAAAVVGEEEREFARSRGPLGLAVVSSEEAAASARKAVLDAGRRVSELDGILADARREERVAARELFFARCVGALRGSGIRKAIDRAKKTRDVTNRAARDRVMLMRIQAETKATYLRRSAETRGIQRDLIEKEKCWREAVEVYGALRSLAENLMKAAGLWEGLSLSCGEVAEEWMDDSGLRWDLNSKSARTQFVERWHTISVALRLFRIDHIDSVQSVLKLLEQ